jgi:hypothetical protein
MTRKRLILITTAIALFALLFGAFRFGQQMARRIAARDAKKERIKEIDYQLKRLNWATIRLSIARDSGMTQPDPGQRVGIGAERDRLLKERGKLQKELCESADLPFSRSALR